MSRFPFSAALGLLLAPGLFGAIPGHAARRVPLPLVFTPGGGPAGSPARFLGRTAQYTLRLSPEGFEVLPAGGAAPLRIRLEGANRRPALEGVDPLPGRSFYYFGNHPDLWRTNVPNFAKVRYRAVYPGIDMVFYGNAGQLEYDLILAPHAGPESVRMRFDGARRLGLEANGDLRIETASGVLWQKKPAVYQEGAGGRRQVSGRYVVDGKRVRFALDGYDPSEGLVIDPVLVYATYFGGTGDETPGALAVDAAGNAYITGYTVSADYPHTASYGSHGSADVFVTKIDPTGQKVLYSVLLGGNLADEAFAIAVDPAGNAYVAGTTISDDFPTLNPDQKFIKGDWDAFVLKLDPSGNLLYSTYLGGDQKQPCGCDPNTYAYGIAVDAAGNAYVTGLTWSSNFPYTAVTHTPDNGDAFVTEYSPTGKRLFSTLIGGSGFDTGNTIAVGASGMVYVAGSTTSLDLPVTGNAFQVKYGGTGPRGYGDAWVAKINPQSTTTGGVLVALTYLGGESDDFACAIKVDAAENVYLSGWTLSQYFPVTRGTYQTAFGGGSYVGDGFIAKLNSALTSAIYSTYFGGAGEDLASSFQLDGAGDVFVTGWTTSAGLTPASLVGSNPTAIQPAFVSGTDGYLAELNPAGTSVAYFTFLAQGGVTRGADIGMDSAGRLYQLFGTTSQGMTVVSPALQGTLAGGQDLYLTKIDLAAVPAPAIVSINVAGGGSDIAQNTWIEIHGNGLAPASAAAGLTWSSAPEFASGRMPTQLGGVSVQVNGKPAYVYYISPAQINVLTPLDNSTGMVAVTVTNGANTSAPFTVNMKAVAPSFLLLGPTRYVVAQHLDYSLLGPASMSVPGYAFTPAQPGEIVTLYGAGFGLPSGGLVAGLATQSGALPTLPVFLIGGSPATVLYAGVISPGLYQFDVAVPSSAANGDVSVTAGYGGSSTPAGALIPVAH